MRILFLVHSLDPNTGWGRFSKELITRFEKQGIEVHVMSENASGYPSEIVVLRNSWKALMTVPVVRKYIKKYDIDIVHSFELNPYGITASLAVLGLSVRQCITATGAYSVRPLYQKVLEHLAKFAYNRADKILCISSYIEEEIKKKVDKAKTTVVTLGVDQQKFTGERKPAAKPFILSVGNYGPRKGYEVSLEAFAAVAKKKSNIEYYIVGAMRPGEERRLRSLIEKLGITNRVKLTGSLGDDKLRELYLSATIFILTAVNIDYHFEGFGLVFLEAASAGLPVIGTLDNGIVSAVQNGKNGILVPQNDVQATADALIKILDNSELQAKYSSASVEWAKYNSWNRTVDKYVDIYKRLIS